VRWAPLRRAHAAGCVCAPQPPPHAWRLDGGSGEANPSRAGAVPRRLVLCQTLSGDCGGAFGWLGAVTWQRSNGGAVCAREWHGDTGVAQRLGRPQRGTQSVQVVYRWYIRHKTHRGPRTPTTRR